MKKSKQFFWKKLLAVVLSAVMIAVSMPDMYISASETAVENKVVVYDELPEEPTTVVEVFSENGKMEKVEAEIDDFKNVPADQSAVGDMSSTVSQISDSQSEVNQIADLGFAYKDLINNGSDSDNFCILIAGDGYTASEQDKFLQVAQRIADYFLTKSPFNEASIRAKINIRAVCVVSNQSGVSMDPNNLYDSFFKSSFNNYGIERLICIHDNNALNRVIQQYMPSCNVPIVVGNSTVYGGSGGSVCVLSAHESSPEIAVHEFGHTGGGLADEYWETTTDSTNGYEAPNRTANSNPNTCKWADLIGVNGVGLYAFDENPAWYRPHQNCEMRYLNCEFCEVCKRQLRKVISGVVDNSVGDNEVISNADQLVEYARKVNAGAKTYNKTVTLANDINLSGSNNIQIMTEFNGTFNGNGHTISGININSESGTAGFIGTLGASGVVKNLALENANVVGNGYYVGGIVGYNYGNIYECSFNGYANGYSGTGGIVGCNEGTVRDCYNKGSIYSTNQVSGGIVGWMTGGTMYNCYNYGKITVGNSWYGAVCGYNPGGNIYSCYYLSGTASEGVAGNGDNGAAAKSSTEFSNGTVTSLLNSVSNVWKQGNGMPVFAYSGTSYDDGLTECTRNVNTYPSYWGYYVGEWAGATARYSAGSGWDPITLKVTANSGAAWGVQLFTAPISVTPGNTYTIYITLNSNKAGASVLFKENTTDTVFETKTLVAGDNSFSGTFTATGETAEFFFDLGAVAADTTIKAASIGMNEIQKETTTTQAPTEAPTDAPTQPADGYTECTLDQNIELGAWGYYVGSWSPATARYLGGTSLDNFALKVTSNGGAAWGVQAFTKPITVNAGSTYKVNVTLNSDKAGSTVMFKDDITGVVFETKELASGNNVFTGTFTAADTAKLFFDLGAVAAGTTLKVTSFSLTEEVPAETTTMATETTTVVDTTGWTVVENSNNALYYRNVSNMSIVNVQQPGFAAESGIYMTAAEAPNYITINGTKVSSESVAVQGAGAVVYTSALKASVNKITFNRIDGSVISSVEIKNINGSGEEEVTTDSNVEVNPGDIGSSDIAAPEDVEVYNFYAQGQGYRVDFTEVDAATAYKVYVGNSATEVATVSGSGEYIPASALSAYADDELHSVYVASVDNDGNVSVRSSAYKTRITKLTNSSKDPSELPRVYVVTNEGIKGGSSIIKAEKTPASLTIIGTNGVVQTVSDGGTIKLRGNSTSLADKPAYNIAFNSKKEVLSGAAKGKKWCLLANAYDKSMMRSKLAMDFGNTLGGVATPDQEYAEVYIDGVYKGLFLISEPADNDRSGVAIDDSDESTEIMFEYEAEKVEDGQTYYTTGLGQRFVTAEPEGLDTNTEKYKAWVNTLETFESALRNASTSDTVLNYIDVDSFVDMYIANEYFNTVDFGYSSVKYYTLNDANGNQKIYAGALWDFDLSSGNYSLAEARQYDKFRCQEVSAWFRYLMQNKTFKNKVIAKFKSMQPTIQNIYMANELGASQIDQIYDYIKEARIRNYTSVAQGGAGWSESTVDSAEIKYYPYSYGTVAPYNTYTYDQHVDFLRDWLQNRNEWMCAQWNINMNEEEPGITTSDDIKVTGYQMSSSVDGIAGNMGFRIVYQTESKVEGQTVTEQGLVYGLGYNNNAIADDELVYGSTNQYVKSFKSTDAGKLSTVMGDSETASYYVMTMKCGSKDEGISTAAYTTPYYVRSYAKLSDGTIVYSDVVEFTIFEVADYIYQGELASTKSTHDYLYSEILSYVNGSYAEKEFNWRSSIVQ